MTKNSSGDEAAMREAVQNVIEAMSQHSEAMQLSDDERNAIAVTRDVIKRQYESLARRWNDHLIGDNIPIEVKLSAMDTLDGLSDALINAASVIDFMTQTEGVFLAFGQALETMLAEDQDQDEARTEGQDAADKQTGETQAQANAGSIVRAEDMIKQRTSRRESTPV